MDISIQVIMLLFFVAMIAGCLDAIAGGGGLITIPALMAVGLPPAAAIATNKLGGVAGSFAATMHFLRIRQIDLHRSRWMMLTTFLGALLGGFALTQIDGAILMFAIPILLIGFAVYFLISPKVGEKDKKQAISLIVYALFIAPIIGFYDGFFGPGTGTFLAISFVSLLGYNLVKATAHAKLLNFCSNVASLAFFIPHGSVVWAFGLPMLAGQLIGGHIGARLVVTHGHGLIKIIMAIVALAISAKMLWAG